MQLATANRLVCLVLDHEGHAMTYELKPETSVIIGSDDRCGMRIQAGSISPRHCMVRQVAGDVVLMDWFSESGTYVNGHRVAEETVIFPDDQIRVGECELRLVIRDLNAGPVERVKSDVPFASQLEPVEAVDPPACEEVAAVAEPLVIPANESADMAQPDAGRMIRLQVELAQALEEIALLRQELDSQTANATPNPLLDTDPATRDEMEMLRAQNRQLQMDLEERDAALMQGWNPEGQTSEPMPVISSSETEQLVERLEQLLDELHAADRRISTMDDLLRSSAEESQAEMEEREQLESWVRDIEKRIVEREETWQAERASLEAKIAQLKTQCLATESIPPSPVAGASPNSADRIIHEWRRKYEIALEQLESTHRENSQLKKSMTAQSGQVDLGERVKKLESDLRQKDVDLSQERAAVARIRAEMDRIRADAERMPRIAGNANDTDIRIQAFRDHLRGIHEQEQIEKREQKAQGLATRLSKLWQRLEGGGR